MLKFILRYNKVQKRFESINPLNHIEVILKGENDVQSTYHTAVDKFSVKSTSTCSFVRVHYSAWAFKYAGLRDWVGGKAARLTIGNEIRLFFSKEEKNNKKKETDGQAGSTYQTDKRPKKKKKKTRKEKKGQSGK